MKAYRLALHRYADTSGEGAKLHGGRWNLPGYAALYAGSSISASLLERLTIDPELLSANRFIEYSVIEIMIPDQLIYHPKETDLPTGWNHIPPLLASQTFGTRLLKSGRVAFAVPSVLDPTSLNYVINPLAKDFELLQFKVYPLELDKRIIRE